jgi:hypothetical protein
MKVEAMLRARWFQIVMAILCVALAGCANPARPSASASPIAPPTSAPASLPVPISATTIAQPPTPASTEQPLTATVPSPSPTSDLLSDMATVAALAQPPSPPTFTPTIDPATLPTVPAETASALVPLPLRLKGAQISRIAISPDYANDHTILVAANDQRLYRSTNAGASWKSQLLGQIDALVFSPDYTNDHRIFVGLVGETQASRAGRAIQIQLSVNQGQSWQKLDSPGTVPLLGGMRLFISPAYAQDHTLFATLFGWSSLVDDPVIGQLYRSIDNGASWALIDTPCQAHHLAISPTYQQDQKLYIGCYAVGRSSSNGLGVHRSSDNGASWQRLTWDAVTSLVLVPTTPQPTLFVHATHSTDDGITWTDPKQNIGRAIDIIVPPDYATDHTLLALTLLTPNESTAQSLIRSVDDGNTWTLVSDKLAASADAPRAVLAVGRTVTNELVVLIGQGDQLWSVRQ